MHTDICRDDVNIKLSIWKCYQIILYFAKKKIMHRKAWKRSFCFLYLNIKPTHLVFNLLEKILHICFITSNLFLILCSGVQRGKKLSQRIKGWNRHRGKFAVFAVNTGSFVGRYHNLLLKVPANFAVIGISESKSCYRNSRKLILVMINNGTTLCKICIFVILFFYFSIDRENHFYRF